MPQADLQRRSGGLYGMPMCKRHRVHSAIFHLVNDTEVSWYVKTRDNTQFCRVTAGVTCWMTGDKRGEDCGLPRTGANECVPPIYTTVDPSTLSVKRPCPGPSDPVGPSLVEGFWSVSQNLVVDGHPGK
jgi:hypothetical protein